MGRTFALQVVSPGLFPAIPHGPYAPLRIVPECKARVWSKNKTKNKSIPPIPDTLILYTQGCIHDHMRPCPLHTHMFAYAHILTYACTYAHRHAYKCTHMLPHTHTNTEKPPAAPKGPWRDTERGSREGGSRVRKGRHIPPGPENPRPSSTTTLSPPACLTLQTRLAKLPNLTGGPVSHLEALGRGRQRPHPTKALAAAVPSTEAVLPTAATTPVACPH